MSSTRSYIVALRQGAVASRGGGTGLVGGRSTGVGPLILSLERMAALRGLWPENVLIAEAGMTPGRCVTWPMRRAAFPLSLASQGTAAIGVPDQCRRVTALRYGTARALCLGIEAVCPTGAWSMTSSSSERTIPAMTCATC